MEYVLILTGDDEFLYQEICRGSVVRYCTLDGVTVGPPAESQVSNPNPAPPTWALPDPEPSEPQTGKRRLTKQEFIDRFLPAEMLGLLGAAKQSPAVEAWLFRFNNLTPDPDGTSVDLDDPRTIAGLQALEAGGLIGEGRANAILS